MMKEQASEKKEQQTKDCYKSFELVLLAILYSTLTVLYLTASTLLQFAFLAVVSLTVTVAQCQKCLGLKER